MIIRVEKTRNYTKICNVVLNDPTLSWEAKGIAVYLLSKPDDWKFKSEQLWEASTNGLGAVKRTMRELEDRGYLHRRQYRNDQGRWEWEQILWEIPKNRSEDNPEENTVGRKPSDGKPSDAKPSDAKPSDAKPSDAKPDDGKPDDGKPDDGKPSHLLSTVYQVLSPITDGVSTEEKTPPLPPVGGDGVSPASFSPTNGEYAPGLPYPQKRSAKVTADAFMGGASEAKLDATLYRQLTETVLDLTGMTAAVEAGDDARMNRAKSTVILLANMGYRTPDDLKDLAEKWYTAYAWKKTKPSFDSLKDYASILQSQPGPPVIDATPRILTNPDGTKERYYPAEKRYEAIP